MKINIYITDPTADSTSHSSYWMLQFLEGLKRHDEDVSVVKRGTQNIGCDLSITWGYIYEEVKRYHKATNTDILVVERGYTPNRSEWCMAGLNGLNGLANFNNKDMPKNRWEKYHNGKIFLDNPTGDYVLILGQTNGDTALYGLDVDQWAEEVITYFKELDVPYIYRPHPGTSATLFKDSMPDLDLVLDRASCVVTYNSSAGVAAILRGKPTIAMHEGSMVWDVSSHSLEDYNKRFIPDRTQWAYDFAYTQWRLEEFASGEAWEHLKGAIDGS